ncbi:MAG: Jag N-terminal domain-containing protein [Caldilineae bacterium]|nr:Jag N-terminal domain-containing protein [Caldilineae bacterium]
MSDSDSSSVERKVVEVSAPTVDEAIARGLVRLGGLARSEVRIEILGEGRAGLLGFGAEEARVRISTLLPGEQSASPATPSARAETPASRPPAAPKPASPTPTAPKPASPTPAAPRRESPPAAPAPRAVTPAAAAPKPKPGAAPRRDAEQEPARPVTDEAAAAAREIVEQLLGRMGFEEVGTEIKSSLLPVKVEDETSLVVSIHGPGTDRLTRKDGRGLQSLQFIARLLLSRRLGYWSNLLLDVDDDRARRIKEIYMMAEQSAELVEREGRPVSLPPMTAYERRVVHLALRDHDSIATQSIGHGPGRKVTVRLKDQLLPEL